MKENLNVSKYSVWEVGLEARLVGNIDWVVMLAYRNSTTDSPMIHYWRCRGGEKAHQFYKLLSVFNRSPCEDRHYLVILIGEEKRCQSKHYTTDRTVVQQY